MKKTKFNDLREMLNKYCWDDQFETYDLDDILEILKFGNFLNSEQIDFDESKLSSNHEVV